MKLIIITLSFFWISYSCSSLAQEQPTIVTFDYPGFMNNTNDKSVGSGFAINVVNAAFKKVEIKPAYRFEPMVRSIQSLKKGKYPMMLGSLNQYSKDEQQHIIGIQYGKARILLYYLKSEHGELQYSNLNELAHFKIGSIRGSSANSILKKSGISPDVVSSMTQNFNKLLKGRIDFVAAIELTGSKIITDHFNSFKDNIATLEKPLTSIPLHLIFSKNKSEELANQFIKGLETIKADGTYLRLAKSHYGETVSSKMVLNMLH